MDSPEVHQLVLKAKQLDQVAFGQLYNIFATPIRRFIRFKVSTQEQCDDILQNTFLKAWLYLPRFDESQLHFEAWLYRISRNLISDHYRLMYRRPSEVNIDDHSELTRESLLEEKIDTGLAIDRLRFLLPRLSAGYQRVIDLRFMKEYSTKETAKITGLSSLSVRVAQHRALKKLAALTQRLPVGAPIPIYE